MGVAERFPFVHGRRERQSPNVRSVCHPPFAKGAKDGPPPFVGAQSEGSAIWGKLLKVENMAERVGFEPTIPVKVCPLSRRIVSTAHAPLRTPVLSCQFSVKPFVNDGF